MKTKKNEVSFAWTQEKINDLISLYQSSECLWNVLTEDYKSREKRDIAISSICSSLNITREQFSKKIHNLRNQFNYEAKKVFQRNDHVKNSYRSKWEYYDKLFFLKNVIAPRPGPNYVLSDYDPCVIDPLKADKSTAEVVHILDTKPGLEHDVVFYHESPTSPQNNSTVEPQIISNNNNTYSTISIQRAVSTHQQVDNNLAKSSYQSKPKTEEQVQNKAFKMEKRQEMTTRSKKKRVSSSVERKTPVQEHDHDEIQTFEISLPESTPKKIMKRDSSFMSSSKIVQHSQQNYCNLENQVNQVQSRDEHDLFGEFVASELRNLNHNISRKKLKRRIMQVMLDTANEDDDLTD